jgi:16S rRNA pseudouridine516 synthase
VKARSFLWPWPEILFRQGFGTRHECLGLLAAGRVRHEGRVLAPDAEPVATDALVFEVDGTAWPWREPAIVLLHKPAGVECSQSPRDHASVLSLLPAPLRCRGVQPIGRLDVDTTGLLVLTDSGPLIHRLTHPKRHVSKVYLATTRHAVDASTAQALCSGVVLHDDPRPVRAAACEVMGPHTLRLTLTDGRYHQVKRMVAAVANRCEALHRVSFGPWQLPDDLPPGHWRWAGAAAEPAALA